jgi:NADH-quinone oxidoreductase subunit A
MPGSYLPSPYLAIGLILLFAVAFAGVTLLVGRLFRLRKHYAEKLSAYESGNPPSEEPRFPFNVKFYLIAILFVVFDVEAIFLYPWAIVFDELGVFAFVEMVVFIGLLLVGYLYAWKKGALQWEK